MNSKIKYNVLKCSMGFLVIGISTRSEFRSGAGGICSGSVDLTGSRPVPQYFSCWIICFLYFALMSYLYHVHPSSSQTVSRAPLQFPGWITCYHTVPRLYHMLPSRSLARSRAPLQLPG